MRSERWIFYYFFPILENFYAPVPTTTFWKKMVQCCNKKPQTFIQKNMLKNANFFLCPHPWGFMGEKCSKQFSPMKNSWVTFMGEIGYFYGHPWMCELKENSRRNILFRGNYFKYFSFDRYDLRFQHEVLEKEQLP